MDLKSGSLYWPTTVTEALKAEPLDRDFAAEVLVAGSGITGALVADELARRGMRVVVVDRRSLSTGSTPASTALVQYEIDTLLIELIRELGVDHARGAYRACRGVLDEMIELVRSLETDCELAARRSLFLAARAGDREELRAEVAARREAGLEVQWLEQGELRDRFGIARPGAILSDLALELNPVKLTAALLSRASRHGALMFANTELSFDSASITGDHLVIPTVTRGQGDADRCGGAAPSISCDHLVIATGYETPEQFSKIRRITRLRSTFAVATAPLPSPPWPQSVLVWERADPYFYARSTPDGRVVLGGEDIDEVNPEARDRQIPRAARTLMTKLADLFPHLDASPEFAWAGTFAETEDGLPFIGGTRDWPRVSFALGYGGNGISFSLLAAKILAARICGEHSPYAGLFRFDRPAAGALDIGA